MRTITIRSDQHLNSKDQSDGSACDVRVFTACFVCVNSIWIQTFDFIAQQIYVSLQRFAQSYDAMQGSW